MPSRNLHLGKFYDASSEGAISAYGYIGFSSCLFTAYGVCVVLGRLNGEMAR